jgi:hypothetical protein
VVDDGMSALRSSSTGYRQLFRSDPLMLRQSFYSDRGGQFCNGVARRS